MSTRFDLLIFDCDGVLVDSEVLAVRTMREVLNAAGVPATDAMILRCFGMKQADTLLRIAEETAHDIPLSALEQLWPATEAAFRDALQPMDGAEAFLRQPPEAKRCVASSSHPDRIQASLAITNLAGFFGDNVFSSHQVARGKPAPDLFLYAAAKMGVDPNRCAVIEDSVFGVQGALAAGMTPFGFTGGSHSQPGHAEALQQAGAVAVAATWAAAAPLLVP